MSSMKVGTDAVLLGAWAELNTAIKTILDIGTGTGLIALIMAQRHKSARIKAIDIEPRASEEAALNFQKSPWSDRLKAHSISLQNFNSEETFDLIISNPPFFEFNFLGIDAERTIARQQSKLSFQDLLIHSKRLMAEDATCHYILPYFETEDFLKLSSEQGLFPYRTCYVKGNKDAPMKRTLISLSKEKRSLLEEELIIEVSRHQYTEAYIDLVKDFYLNM